MPTAQRATEIKFQSSAADVRKAIEAGVDGATAVNVERITAAYDIDRDVTRYRVELTYEVKPK